MSTAEAARYSTPVDDWATGSVVISAFRYSIRSGSGTKQPRCQRLVNVCFDGAGSVECFPDADVAGIGVDLYPEQVRKLIE